VEFALLLQECTFLHYLCSIAEGSHQKTENE